jgi:Mg/Co/Ni transporter MgtE/transcriptional regulator with XRE-family HTH domain
VRDFFPHIAALVHPIGRSPVRRNHGRGWDGMGQYRNMPERTPAPAEPPDIRSLADLGRELRALRLAAPRPSLADDPLTLRDLAELTGLPRSTLGNAESGRILPRAEVVYRVALACGVPADRIAAWTAARNRIAGRRDRARPSRRREEPVSRRPLNAGRFDAEPLNGRRLDTEPADPRRFAGEPPGARRFDAEPFGGRRFEREPAGAEPVDSAFLARQLRKLEPHAAADLLQRHSVPAAAECLEMVPAASAATCLAAMVPTFAAACLTRMPGGRGADCLDRLDPAKAQQLLGLEESGQSLAHLRQMLPETATAAIAEMPPVTAAARLNQLSADVASRITRELPAKAKAALILTEDLPERLTHELLFSLDFDGTVQLLRTAPIPQVAKLLTSMPEDPAAGVFAKLSRRRRLVLLGEVGPVLGGRLLGEVPVEVGADAVESLPTDLVVSLLERTGRLQAAQVLESVPADRKRAVLAAMRFDTATAVRAVLERLPFLRVTRLRAEAGRGRPG